MLVATLDDVFADATTDAALLLRLTELELAASTLSIEEATLVVTLELTLWEVAFEEVEEVATEELATDLMLLIPELFPPLPPPHAVKLMARARDKLARRNCCSEFIAVIMGYMSVVLRK